MSHAIVILALSACLLGSWTANQFEDRASSLSHGEMTEKNDVPLRDLKNKIAECTEEAVCRRSYILVAELTQWLRSRVHPGKSTTQYGRLLLAVYGDDIPPPSTLKLAEGDSCCLLVFCILLLIGRGNLIHVFQRFNILDKHLPIPLQQLQTRLHGPRIPDPLQLAAEFDEKQWPFCPAKFDLHMGQEYNEHRILPICHKAKINEKGGTAQLWQIEVKEEFVSHALRQAVEFSRYNFSTSNTEPDWRYQFALKSFGAGNMAVYENEMRAYDALAKHKGMVRFLTDYTHTEKSGADIRELSPGLESYEEQATRNTFNLLLEFGECDLDEFFAQQLPPVLQEETEQFWRALFDVAHALEGLHNLPIDTHGVVRELHGWHADVKPDNILSVQGKFKLSDPGFAVFVEKVGKDLEECVMGGTETYGAPERHPRRRGTISAVSQTIDIWSLGCVFSIAATWVVFGYQGIQQFRRVREKAISQIVPGSFHHQQPQRSTSISAGDYFHDSRKVLDVVTDWHKVLRNSLRKTDTVTSSLLDVVDRKMLLGTANSRVKARDLCSQLSELIARSESAPRIEMPENIMETLLEADKDAPSPVPFGMESVIPEHLPGLDSRKARKSRLLEQPLMKTAHRSEGLRKSVLASHHKQPAVRDPPITPITTQRGASGHTKRAPSSFAHAHNQSPEAQVDTPIYSHNSIPDAPKTSQPVTPTRQVKRDTRTPRTHTPQDIFQAQEEIKERDKHNIFRKEHKDKLLTKHFGNRDLKFLVDDGESMRRHWAWAKALLVTLVEKAAGQDENGLDLSFTLSKEKLENEKSKSSKWEKRMKEAEPVTGARTNMRNPLHKILRQYLEYVKDVWHRKRSQPTKTYRKMTLIVLTDGIWAGMGQNQNAVNDTIVKFVRELELVVGDLVDRPFSIEFVQFGHDPEATYRLRRLDTDMKWSGIPDIIDTEPADGDINKMLLGSFVEEYDDEDEDGQLQDLGTPLTQTASPEELLFVNSPSRPSHRESTNLSSPPPEPSVFVSRPTG
ncbi:MAG: hypothetical protein Q9169_002521 [Polycauliona sp. 2 TL-2023]